MAVATALAIGLAASAASSAYAAHKQSSAASNAAKTQAASADKAMALQSQMANRAIDVQNQMMYGGTGGTGGMPGQGGGISGMYAPYTNSAPATLSALHEYLGIPGADESQTAVPYGAYGQPMRPQYGGGPMPGSGGMAMSMRPPMGAPGVPLMAASALQAPTTGQPFRPRVGPIQARAAGGWVTPGQPYLVGEQGPELMIPSQPGNIQNAQQTQQVAQQAALARFRQRQSQYQPMQRPMPAGGMGGQMLAQSPGGWSAPGYVPPQPFQGGMISGYDPGTGPRIPGQVDPQQLATLAGLYQMYQQQRQRV